MSLPARARRVPTSPDVDDYYASYELTTDAPFDPLEEQFFADGERLAERAEAAAAEMTALLADLARAS